MRKEGEVERWREEERIKEEGRVLRERKEAELRRRDDEMQKEIRGGEEEAPPTSGM
jgi:hypothetical protein